MSTAPLSGQVRRMNPPGEPGDTDRAAALARAEAFGVDLASLRARRALTPTERLLKNEQALALVAALRAARPDAPDPDAHRRPR